MGSLSSRKIADHAIAVLDDHKATNIRCLDVSHLTSLMDFMIVGTGRSDRHVRALGDALIESCKENGIEILGSEGQEAAEWLLVDLVDVVVHVMLPRTREFYDIEKLWDISPRGDDANRTHIGVR
ncbi:MAG TPA: ribosome silencing factor [Gammaproteobacteria bacterium]|nr:ribosome silencing factor [Gammaproteobacteria bacterium]